MSEHEKCPICNGKRFLMGQGGFRKECYYCNGAGRVQVTHADGEEDSHYANKENETKTKTEAETDTETKSVKKRKTKKVKTRKVKKRRKKKA